MKRRTAINWLRHLGIALLILGFVRLPLPALHSQNLGHHDIAGQFCPLSDFQTQGVSATSSTDRASGSEVSWQLSVLAMLNGSSIECEKSCEDFGDGECSDSMDNAADAESAILRVLNFRSVSRDLALSLDSVGLSTDHPNGRLAGHSALRPWASCNGTSPSYGPSIHALYQRWVC